jgi:hypothetical protein
LDNHIYPVPTNLLHLASYCICSPVLRDTSIGLFSVSDIGGCTSSFVCSLWVATKLTGLNINETHSVRHGSRCRSSSTDWHYRRGCCRTIRNNRLLWLYFHRITFWLAGLTPSTTNQENTMNNNESLQIELAILYATLGEVIVIGQVAK